MSSKSEKYKKGPERDKGTGTNEDVLKNSGFGDEVDAKKGKGGGDDGADGLGNETDAKAGKGGKSGKDVVDDSGKAGKSSGKKDGGKKGDGKGNIDGAGDGGPDDPGVDGDEVKPKTFNLNVPFKNFCSQDATESSGSNVTQAASGVVVKFYSQAGQLVHEYKDTPANLRNDLINKKTITLTVKEGQIPNGSYYVGVCDAARTGSCNPNPKFVADVRKDLPEPDEDEGGQLHVWENADNYLGKGSGLVALVTDVTVANNTVTSAQNGWALYMGPDAGASQYHDCQYKNSPLIVDLDNVGIVLSPITSGVRFDVDADGKTEQISWPIKKGNAFLVLDQNDNGKIDSGNELFGNHHTGPDGKKAANGFLALAKYDANGDKKLDAADPVYARLRLWTDTSFDGVSQPNELASLADAGLTAVDLDYIDLTTDPRFFGAEVDDYGNETRQRSVVEIKSGKRLVIDLWFRIVHGL